MKHGQMFIFAIETHFPLLVPFSAIIHLDFCWMEDILSFRNENGQNFIGFK